MEGQGTVVDVLPPAHIFVGVCDSTHSGCDIGSRDLLN